MRTPRDDAPPSAAMCRVRALVSGQVQGVGFRVATARRARALGADGWVRNRADGRVECVVEGPAETVEAVLQFLSVGPRGAVVSRVAASDEAPEGLRGFEIREGWGLR